MNATASALERARSLYVAGRITLDVLEARIAYLLKRPPGSYGADRPTRGIASRRVTLAGLSVSISRPRWGEGEWTARDLYDALPEWTRFVGVPAGFQDFAADFVAGRLPGGGEVDGPFPDPGGLPPARLA